MSHLLLKISTYKEWRIWFVLCLCSIWRGSTISKISLFFRVFREYQGISIYYCTSWLLPWAPTWWYHYPAWPVKDCTFSPFIIFIEISSCSSSAQSAIARYNIPESSTAGSICNAPTFFSQTMEDQNQLHWITNNLTSPSIHIIHSTTCLQDPRTQLQWTVK